VRILKRRILVYGPALTVLTIIVIGSSFLFQRIFGVNPIVESIGETGDIFFILIIVLAFFSACGIYYIMNEIIFKKD